MLTGDKGETAHTIGVSAGLVDEDKHNILKIQATTVEGLRDEIELIDKFMKRLFNQSTSSK